MRSSIPVALLLLVAACTTTSPTSSARWGRDLEALTPRARPPGTARLDRAADVADPVNPVPGSIGDPVADPAPDAVADPVPDPVADPVADRAPEPVADRTADPFADGGETLSYGMRPAFESPLRLELERASTAQQGPPPQRQPPPPPPARRQNKFTLKGGYYGSTEDKIDDGYIFTGDWTTYLSPFFGVEFEVGYLNADGHDSGFSNDLWAIPIMSNARLDLPIWKIDCYGGAGIGTFYYDVDRHGVIGIHGSGFTFGADFFLGASLNLSDRWAVGIEGKYYLTEDVSALNSGLDAYAVMLTLGFSI